MLSSPTRPCLRSERPEPLSDGGDVEGGLVANGVPLRVEGVRRPPELPFFFRFASWSLLTRNKSELVFYVSLNSRKG
jgi:hypothetical protein